ncbi:hypothetical protein JI666_13980 [Bacillus sp. NTK071]|uniref:DUF7686 domain-containing protein n=1 Tax=Bacillus sp. NTK071 TaxID=2802175 RepID=UPI001A8FDA0C|nr:hypothetical protein [Bacillus sp. NTK071]MBN8209861.1 hypothetical protein [Bacillus sp. NTK071]
MKKCDRCGNSKATIILTDVWQERLCDSCFNDVVADEVGVKLDTIPEELEVTDYSGTSRMFTVQQRLHPEGLFLEATENIEYGYEFAVHGELECNQTELYERLLDKVKRGVSKQFTEVGVFPDGQKYQSIIDDEVVGRIDHDEMSPSFPMVLIDGQPYTWEQFGEMVKSFEGFQIQMKFFDMTDDVE